MFGLPAHVLGQISTNQYAPQGIEYAPAGNILGDQTNPWLALNSNGGYLVWQDNVTDGDGLGISAVMLNSTFSTPYGNFRVNLNGANDQENPRVSLLSGGGAVFVWQGGPQGYQNIFARFLTSSNIWATGDVMVNSSTNFYQVEPAVATLADGNVVVTYGSFSQDTNDGFQGVFGQILSPAGVKVGGEFQINQFTPFNQRSSAVSAFTNGNFIVTWISEQENGSASLNSGTLISGYNSVDVYARIFNSNAVPQGNEFRVNTSTNRCASPAVATASDNSYTIAWAQKDPVTLNNGWDVFGRTYNKSGAPGNVEYVNTQLYGDQLSPQICSLGTDYMVVWTSYGQDGSHEGVYGQFLHGDGSFSGGELRVNTTTLNSQKYQCVASDGSTRFLAAWSSFEGLATGMDIEAQSYATVLQPLPAPGAPMVQALNDIYLDVTWAPVTSFSISNYNLTIDSTTVTNLTNNYWCNKPSKYQYSSTHTFQLTYTTTDGRVSPSSVVSSGTTWASDNDVPGLPDDWVEMYYGLDPANWPASYNTLLAPGFTVRQALWEGVNPTNPATWLKQSITSTPEGLFLNWNTVPGGVYQVLSSTDLKTWNNYGPKYFAPGASYSVYLGLGNSSYYKIQRIFF
jgi:hypothetical protein